MVSLEFNTFSYSLFLVLFHLILWEVLVSLRHSFHLIHPSSYLCRLKCATSHEKLLFCCCFNFTEMNPEDLQVEHASCDALD